MRRVRRWCDVQVAYGLTETGPTVTVTRFTDSDEKRARHRGAPAARRRGAWPSTCVTGALHGPPRPSARSPSAGPDVMRGYVRMPARDRAVVHAGRVLPHRRPRHHRRGRLPRASSGGGKETILARRLPDLPARGRGPAARASGGRRRVRDRRSPRRARGAGLRVHRARRGSRHHGRARSSDFARDTMADYKVPDLVRFFDAFPMTGSGKVQATRARAHHRARPTPSRIRVGT